MARGYDKLYLDITLDVLKNMAADLRRRKVRSIQKEKLAEIQGSEQKLIEEFNKKYGDGTLDLESGTFTSNKS